MTAKRDLKRRVRQRQTRTGEAYVTARRHVVAASAGTTDGDAGADPEADSDAATGGEAVDPADVTASDPASATADSTTASAGAGALRVAADTVTGTEAAAPSATAATAPAGSVAPAEGAAVAEIEPADTGPVRATAVPPAAAPGRDDTAVPTPAAPAPGSSAAAAVSVVELVDVSEQARHAGLVCRVAMFPTLAARVEPASVLARLYELLVETAGDPRFLLFSQVALTGDAPLQPPRLTSLPTLPTFDSMERFVRRARVGIGGVSDDGMTLAFHVAGREGLVPIGCVPHWSSVRGRAASLVLTGIDEMMVAISKRRDWILAEGRADPGRQIADLLTMNLTPRRVAPTLFVIHDGRRHAITRDEFLIGRSRGTVHLAIEDDMVAGHHAAVIRRNGAFYLKDLGSTHGIMYKGMRIDNKRIDEGDVFQLGDHELAFTFQDG